MKAFFILKKYQNDKNYFLNRASKKISKHFLKLFFKLIEHIEQTINRTEQTGDGKEDAAAAAPLLLLEKMGAMLADGFGRIVIVVVFWCWRLAAAATAADGN